MAYDLKLIKEKIEKWNVYLNEYNLPAWESIPTIGLYMDQIVSLMNEYLGILPIAEGKKGIDVITPSTVNNYVRLGIMPAPLKKKYYRHHIAYLILICTLKLTFSISEISALLNKDWSEKEVEKFYKHYVAIYKDTSTAFAKRVMNSKDSLSDNNSDQEITDFISRVAIEANFTKMLYLKMTRLNDVTYKQGSDTFLPH